jgi:hypothetical protein
MNVCESPELWLTGLNVKHVDLKQWFLSITMVAASYMSFSFENFFTPTLSHPDTLSGGWGCAKPKARVVTAEFSIPKFTLIQP